MCSCDELPLPRVIDEATAASLRKSMEEKLDFTENSVLGRFLAERKRRIRT